MAKFELKTRVVIAEDVDTKRLGLMWQSCTDVRGRVEVDHDRMLETDGHCRRCGEAARVTFKPGDRLTLYINDGDLLVIDVNGLPFFLNYTKIKAITPLVQES